MMPPSILRFRTVASCLLCGFCGSGAVMTALVDCTPDCETLQTCEPYPADVGSGGGSDGGGTTNGGGGAGPGGNGGGAPGPLPLEVLDLGTSHSCVLQKSRRLFCWGEGDFGQLGDGEAATSTVPVEVTTLDDSERVSAGDVHTCAIDAMGTVFCWGDNDMGQLGYPDLGQLDFPVIIDVPAARDLDCGGDQDFTCAVTDDDEVYCWGRNDNGQVGQGTTSSIAPPGRVDITSVRAVTAGGAHACALRDDDSLWCWGSNYAGQIGNGEATMTATGNVLEPVQVLTDVASASAGHLHTCAIRNNGTVWCWGSDVYGQLGNGAGGDSPSPAPVSGLASATNVSAGGYHTCARLTSGDVRCWGNNEAGQVDGSAATAVQSPTAIAMDDVSFVAAGWTHSCVVTTSGEVWCWGHGEQGQLGNGAGSSSGAPVKVVGL